MNNNTQISEHLSFWELINKNRIEIPIIQRDYAQGRQDKFKVRNSFLEALQGGLSGDPIELDFVYGSIENKALQPLDGQQRLTTLFLLHWFVARKEKFLTDQVKDVLKKFTYRTRTSSREFCLKLIQEDLDIENRFERISDAIKDSPWFFRSWERDPTISAMLVMLDAIEKRFKNDENLWQKLIGEATRPITFNYIELKNFGLSDDLYIKMNARGKQLSPFENFKAELIKQINEQKWDEGKDITKTFSHLADTKWTDLFWDNGKGKKNFDSAFINFIANMAMTSLATSKATVEREKKVQELFNNPENITSADFDEAGYFNLYQSLNAYSKNGNDKKSFDFPFWQYLSDSDNSFFSVITEKGGLKATYPQRVLFYAQTEFLINSFIFQQDLFVDWMRVVRNIVQNSTIDSAVAFVGAISLIKELSAGCQNIYEFLSKNVVESKFASVQVKEEMLKSKALTTENKRILWDIEDLNFCKGRIEFALYCVDFVKDGDFLDHEKLSKIGFLINTHLSKTEISNDLRRGLLTIKDNRFYNYWTSWTYALDAPKRRLIIDTNDLRGFVYNNGFRHYFKSLMVLMIEKELRILIEEFITQNKENVKIPNWTKRLINEPKLLDNYCKSHTIAIPNGKEHCYLLNVGRPRDRSSCKKIS